MSHATPRRNFRRQQEEVWQQMAKAFRGDFTDKEGWRHDKLVVRVEPWTVTLDIHSEPGYKAEKLYTRFRAPYHNADHFRFALYKKSVFAEIAEAFGAQDVATGHPQFDHLFVVKATDPEMARKLFANKVLRQLLLAHPEVYVRVKQDDGGLGAPFPPGVDELCLEVEGRVEDVNTLGAYFELFAEFLHTLCHIGSAYEDDPHVDLG